MPRFEIAQEFVRIAQVLETDSELRQLMEAVTIELGFCYFALLNHVDLRKSHPGAFQIHNYPNSWANKFITKGLYTDDPILRTCLTRNIGFTWVDVPKLIQISSKQRLIFECAAKEGLADGFTVPVNIPGEFSGSCSFATQRRLVIIEENLLLAQLVGAFAFHAARRLNRMDHPALSRQIRLTQRQRDCLLWAIKGKTDWEIARILGLSAETVAEHLEMARRRYGVTKRLSLAIHAIFDGQISFTEALF